MVECLGVTLTRRLREAFLRVWGPNAKKVWQIRQANHGDLTLHRKPARTARLQPNTLSSTAMPAG